MRLRASKSLIRNQDDNGATIAVAIDPIWAELLVRVFNEHEDGMSNYHELSPIQVAQFREWASTQNG